MKKFWSTVAIALLLSPIGSVAADTISVSQVIHITGVVPPMRNIIVDGRGNIIEITSNTPESVMPKVYLNSFTGPELPLTPIVLKDFEAKTKHVDMQSKELHFSAPNPMAARATRPSLLTALHDISFLRFW